MFIDLWRFMTMRKRGDSLMKSMLPTSGSDTLEKAGSWSFIIGVVVALLSGFLTGQEAWIIPTLAVLGLIVGLLNVGSHETQEFLFAALAIVVVTGLGGATLVATPIIGPQLQTILNSILAFVLPASIVVALREIYGLAANP